MKPYFVHSALVCAVSLGTLTLASCSAQQYNQAEMSPMESAALNQASETGVENEAAKMASDPANPSSPAPQAMPQLIKTAQLSLLVDSMEEQLTQVSRIVKQQGGDVLDFQDTRPSNETARHQVFTRLRVPQKNLEATLEALSQLGTVRSQSLRAEDVSTQLVDFQARLRNLRQTETNLLKIMDRAGSMADVLRVSQELSNTRAQIEQIDAQLKDLSNRVAYSTIELNLEAAVSSPPSGQSLASQMQDTWQNSTHAVGSFTTNLLKLGLWLLAFSPYFLVVALVAWFVHKRTHTT